MLAEVTAAALCVAVVILTFWLGARVDALLDDEERREKNRRHR